MTRKNPKGDAVMSSMTNNGRGDLMQTLAHHDAELKALGGRMTGVESSLRNVQTEMHKGFADLERTIASALSNINTRVGAIDARPTFDLQKAVSTVLSLSVLFSMVVGGIIWVTTNQSAGYLAEQKAINERDRTRLDRHAEQLEKIMDKIGWYARVEPAKKDRP